jgi:hypothetical protein
MTTGRRRKSVATLEQQWDELCKRSHDARRALTAAWKPVLATQQSVTRGVTAISSVDEEARFFAAIEAVEKVDREIEAFKSKHFRQRS